MREATAGRRGGPDPVPPEVLRPSRRGAGASPLALTLSSRARTYRAPMTTSERGYGYYGPYLPRRGAGRETVRR